MSEYRKLLERESVRFALPPGALDRLLERQQRKARNRRVTASATAFLVAGVGIWLAVIAFRGAPRPTLPKRITPANVSRLQLLWSTSVGAPSSAPVISDGAVYLTAGEPGGSVKLYAFPISCSSVESCRPSWYGQLGPASRLTRPAVAGGTIFATADGLYAFSTRCAVDGGRCDPIWTARSTPSAVYSSPVVADGVVYVTSSDGTLEAYAAPRRGETINPSWTGRGGAGLNPPAVSSGNVYTASHPEGLSAFPVGCQTDNGTCEPLWRGNFATSDAGGVAATQDTVYATGARLYAFGRDCGLPQCKPVWFSQGIRAVRLTAPVIWEREVYIGGDRLYAFAVDCKSDACPPVWMGPQQPDPSLPVPRAWSEPVSRSNMVFSSTDRPYAFAAACGEGGSVCAPLWVGTPLTGVASTAVGVSDRVVVVSASDGSIRAFAVAAGS